MSQSSSFSLNAILEFTYFFLINNQNNYSGSLCIIFCHPQHSFFWINIANMNEYILESCYLNLLKMNAPNCQWVREAEIFSLCFWFSSVCFFPKPFIFCLFSSGRGYNQEDAELLVAFGINLGNSANKQAHCQPFCLPGPRWQFFSHRGEKVSVPYYFKWSFTRTCFCVSPLSHTLMKKKSAKYMDISARPTRFLPSTRPVNFFHQTVSASQVFKLNKWLCYGSFWSQRF